MTTNIKVLSPKAEVATDAGTSPATPTTGMTAFGFTGITPPPSPTGQLQFAASPTAQQSLAQTQIDVETGTDAEGKPITTQVTVTASVSWQEIFQGQVGPNGSMAQGISYTSGVTSTDSQTDSFAATLGVEMSEGVNLGFAQIGAKLSASFTATTSETVSVAVAQSSTDSFDFTIDGDGQYVTFQVWQLIVSFGAGGNTLELSLDPSEAYFVQTQFSGSSSS